MATVVRRLALLLVSAVLASSVATPVIPAAANTTDSRPNIILITTDDMNKSDLRWMPKTRRLLRAGGVQVDDFISNHPLCCPARAEILTGQYAQNSGVLDNFGTDGGYQALEDSGNHVGTWLQSSGYKTAFVGKHMNLWPESGEHQTGWTVFNPILKGVFEPYDLTMYNNGVPTLYPGTHTSDLMGQLSRRYIKRFSAAGSPFFIWTSQVSPHHRRVDGKWVRPVPAERHQDLYADAISPSISDLAFNEDDVTDKPVWVRVNSKKSAKRMSGLHRARIRSLRSVDDQVGTTVRALARTGELANTYIFFTSDNGFLMGEHRLWGKNYPYEQALRVPLLVRGPGVTPGSTRSATYGMVDLAPTFVELSGARPLRPLDGRSMMATLTSGAPGYSHYLIQAAGNDHETGWWRRGVRSKKYVYVRYVSGFEELYDMARDPSQLSNVADTLRYEEVRSRYAARLAALSTCHEHECQTGGEPAG